MEKVHIVTAHREHAFNAIYIPLRWCGIHMYEHLCPSLYLPCHISIINKTEFLLPYLSLVTPFSHLCHTLTTPKAPPSPWHFAAQSVHQFSGGIEVESNNSRQKEKNWGKVGAEVRVKMRYRMSSTCRLMSFLLVNLEGME